MQEPKLEPDVTCRGCGRNLTHAATYTHRSPGLLHVYHRCDCGFEWTEHQPAADRSEPICGDELLALHERLQGHIGSLTDLTADPNR